MKVFEGMPKKRPMLAVTDFFKSCLPINLLLLTRLFSISYYNALDSSPAGSCLFAWTNIDRERNSKVGRYHHFAQKCPFKMTVLSCASRIFGLGQTNWADKFWTSEHLKKGSRIFFLQTNFPNLLWPKKAFRSVPDALIHKNRRFQQNILQQKS